MKQLLIFADTEVEKHKFNDRNNLILFEVVDTQKIQVSHMVSSGQKKIVFFIGYTNNDHKTKPICIMLQKMSAYVKSYDGETK